MKAAYLIDSVGGLELAPDDEARVVRPADVPWGEPEKSSILFPSDLYVRTIGASPRTLGHLRRVL